MEMFIYKIGWNSYEEYSVRNFTHDEYFTDEQLEEMVGQAIIDTLERSLGDTARGFLKNNEIDMGGDNKNSDLVTSCIRFDEILRLSSCFIAELEKMGFTLVEDVYDGSCVLFGWAKVCDNEWERETRNSATGKIRDRIPQDYKDQIHRFADYFCSRRNK